MPRRSVSLPPTSFRKPRDLTFRKNDVVRAIHAARAAGVANPRIQIDREGTISIVAGGPVKDSVTVPTDTPDSIIEQL
jgi:hypothetical protein